MQAVTKIAQTGLLAEELVSVFVAYWTPSPRIFRLFKLLLSLLRDTASLPLSAFDVVLRLTGQFLNFVARKQVDAECQKRLEEFERKMAKHRGSDARDNNNEGSHYGKNFHDNSIANATALAHFPTRFMAVHAHRLQQLFDRMCVLKFPESSAEQDIDIFDTVLSYAHAQSFNVVLEKCEETLHKYVFEDFLSDTRLNSGVVGENFAFSSNSSGGGGRLRGAARESDVLGTRVN